MKYRWIAMMILLLLSACGTQPSQPGQSTTAADSTETIPSQLAIPFEPPPAMIDSVFTRLTSTPINMILFPGDEGGKVHIIGLLESENLLYAYFTNGSDIYYAVSPDGVEWALSPKPIFSGLLGGTFQFKPYSVGFTDQGYAIFLSSATIEYGEHAFLYSVWVLSAADPAGPWHLSENPILYGYPGPNGVALYVTDPIVRPYLDGYRMYHRLSFGIESIDTPDFGLAHSMDGLSWRYTRELPTDDMQDEPVLIARAEDENLTDLHILEIWPTDSGWQMLLTVPENEGDLPSLHLAEAQDGLDWETTPAVIELVGADPEGIIVSASAIFFQGSYYLAYCSTPPEMTSYQCFIASH